MSKGTVTLHDLLAEHEAPSTKHYVCSISKEPSDACWRRSTSRDGPYRVLALSVAGDRCDDLMFDAGYAAGTNPFTDARYAHYFLHPELAKERPQLLLNPGP